MSIQDEAWSEVRKAVTTALGHCVGDRPDKLAECLADILGYLKNNWRGGGTVRGLTVNTRQGFMVMGNGNPTLDTTGIRVAVKSAKRVYLAPWDALTRLPAVRYTEYLASGESRTRFQLHTPDGLAPCETAGDAIKCARELGFQGADTIELSALEGYLKGDHETPAPVVKPKYRPGGRCPECSGGVMMVVGNVARCGMCQHEESITPAAGPSGGGVIMGQKTVTQMRAGGVARSPQRVAEFNAGRSVRRRERGRERGRIIPQGEEEIPAGGGGGAVKADALAGALEPPSPMMAEGDAELVEDEGSGEFGGAGGPAED